MPSNNHGMGMNNRISHPDFIAYSQSNLAYSIFFQYTYIFSAPQTNQIPSQYSRSSVNVLGGHYETNDLLADHYGSSNTLINNHLSTTPLNHASTSHLPSPSNTPNTQRKNRRISNIFRQNKDHHNINHQTPEERITKTSEGINMGVGRAIPIKQGLLYKRSSKALNKEWKKKYVCLYSDGRLSYHQNLKEYMDKNSQGKEVYLGLATVRISGRQRPRATNRNSLLPQNSINTSNVSMSQSLKEEVDSLKSPILENEPTGGTSGTSDGGGIVDSQLLTSTTSSNITSSISKESKPNNLIKPPTTVPGMKKKRSHRKLGNTKNQDDEEDCDFEIITCNQKHWEFSACSVEERDEWVGLIEEQIEKCLQGQLSQKQQQNSRLHAERAEVQALRSIAGNDHCADCGSPKPDWASLNLGTLICIECSGIHRNLGSHISRVRSIDLDDWPFVYIFYLHYFFFRIEYLNVMQAMGNTFANNIWEHNAPKEKPKSDSSREQKENWIKLKYEQRLFLPAVPVDKTLGQQVIDAVLARDLTALMILLPRCSEKDVNATVSSKDRRTPIHLACSSGASEYNASPRALDEMGRSALWHAKHNGSKECATILLNTGLPCDYGMTATNFAILTNASGSTTVDYLTQSTFNPQSASLLNGTKMRRQSDFEQANGVSTNKQENYLQTASII